MDSDLIIARIDDTVNICQRTNKPKFLGFLSCEEAVLVQKYLEKRDLSFGFGGGYENPQRVLLGCFPEWMDYEEYPITAVTFKFRKSDSLGHRDVLGSLMALGIKRESVGDILIDEGRAIVFVIKDIAEFVITQTEKIGRVGVTAELGYTGQLPKQSALAEFTDTIASARLDCVVSSVASLSRGAAAEKITAGLVCVNSVVCEKITHNVNNGDIITVRGKGKFILSSIDGKTRKNRVILQYKKYI